MITIGDTIALGSSDLRVAPLGVGTWAWGDTLFWGYGRGYGKSEVAAAFHSSLNAGITLFDTAELYGTGTSERILGQLARSTEQPIVIASKFMPYPWRLSAKSLRGALDASLKRLQIERIDLYQIHFPALLIGIPALMDAMADAVAEGKIRAVGVSNYSAAQMQTAHAALARRGIPLATNQVEYSLLKRAPEVNGVLATCRELGVTLIAYSPLAMGRLPGKYRHGVAPGGARRLARRFSAQQLAAI
jgi:aryl-alcohol dehydrogenase-like predicted oxidoreductase